MAVKKIRNKKRNGINAGTDGLAQKKAVESERKYETLFNTGNDAVFVHGIDGNGNPGRFIEVNSNAVRKYGYSKKEFGSMTVMDLDDPSFMTAGEKRALIRKLVKKGCIVFEGRHVTKKGQKIDVEISTRTFRYGGKFLIMSVARDITKRKIYEKALAESENKLRTIFDSSSEMMYLIEVDNKGRPGRFIDVNDTAIAVIGYSRKKFLTMGVLDLNKSVTRKQLNKLGKIIIEKGRNRFKTFHTTKNGTRIPVEINNRLVTVSGRPALLAVARDMRDEMVYVRKLEEGEREYKTLFNANIDPVFVHEVDVKKGLPGRIVEANEAAVSLFGYSRRELLEMEITDMDAIRDPEYHRGKVSTFKKTGKLDFETLFRKKDGKIIPVKVQVKTFRHGNENLAITSLNDISSAKKHEEMTANSLVYNSARAEIWKLAADRSKTERELISGLVRILGQRLGLKRILHSSPGPKGTTVNGEWKQKGQKSMLNYSTPEMLSGFFNTSHQVEYDEKNFMDRIPQALRPAVRPIVRRFMKIFGNAPILYTPYYVNSREAGNLSAQKISGEWNHDEKGLMLDAVKVISSAIESNRLIKSLEESEEKFKAMFESAPMPYFLYDLHGKFIDGNEAAVRISGHAKRDLLGKSFLHAGLLEPEEIPKAAFELHKNARGMATGPVEFRLKRKDGMRIFVEIKTIPLKLRGKDVVLGAATDITHRKISEQLLAASEEKYKSLFENMSSAFALHRIITDKTGRPVDYEYIEANKAFEKLMGFKLKDIRGKKATQLLPGIKKGRPDWITNFGRVALTGKPWHAEEFSQESGRWYDVIAYSPQKNYFVAIFTEITEKKKLELKLGESENKFRKLFDNSYDCIFLQKMMPDGSVSNFIDVNKTALVKYGYSLEQFRSIGMSSLIPAEISRQVLQNAREKRLKKGKVNLETINVDAKGNKFPVEIQSNIIDINGEKIIISTARDTTQRYRMQEAIKNSEKYFRALTEESSDITLVIDPSARIKYVSPSVRKILGVDPAGIVGAKIGRLSKDIQKEIIMNLFSKIVNDPSFVVQREFQLKDRIFEVIAKNLINDPAVAGIVANCRDITERKRIENKLKSVIWQLEHSNEDLEQFAYAASHDLKEPLRMISNYLELLEMRYSEKLGGEAKEFIYYATSGTKRMYDLIQGMLAYSRIGKKSSEIKMLDVKQIIGEVLQEFGDKALEAEIKVGDIPDIEAIPVEISLLFRNLIGNSLKFTRKGVKPVINIGANDLGHEWQMCVADNGIGIEKEYQQKVFGLFERLHTDSEYPGTGLGLTLCKKIILHLGGRIWIDPEYKDGTRICFTMPKKQNGGAA